MINYQPKFESLEGQKASLINLDENYLDDMWEYSSDERLYEFFEFGPPAEKQELIDYFHLLLRRASKEDAHWWFVRCNGEDKVIGSFGFHDYSSSRKSCEISYAISPSYWGRGFFSEALELGLDFLFDKLDANRICATTAADNLRSIKALEKRGFRKEGQLREFYKNENRGYFDAVILSLLKSNNPSLKNEANF